MKKLFLLLSLVMLCSTIGYSHGAITTIKRSLTSFSTGLKYRAYTRNWSRARATWNRNVRNQTQARVVAFYLKQLEGHIKRSSFKSRWSGIRNSWRSQCDRVRSNSDLTRLMLTLERYVNSNMYTYRWRRARNSWVQTLRRAR